MRISSCRSAPARALHGAAWGAAALLASWVAPARADDTWEFQATVYGYFPTIAGTTVFPPTGQSNTVSVDIDKILDNLKFTFMGAFDARRGRWGAFTDVIYMDVGDSRGDLREFSIGNVGLPAGVTASADFDLEGLVWTLAGTWRALDEPAHALDLYGGLRMLDIEQTLQWQLTGSVASIPVANRSGARAADLQNWDAVVGLRGRAAFGTDGRWFVPYVADVGTGESDVTWQVMAGLGYAFGWGDVLAGWRYVDYQFDDGALQDLNFNGPGIAAVFRW